jgi:hypothetical protein
VLEFIIEIHKVPLASITGFLAILLISVEFFIHLICFVSFTKPFSYWKKKIPLIVPILNRYFPRTNDFGQIVMFAGIIHFISIIASIIILIIPWKLILYVTMILIIFQIIMTIFKTLFNMRYDINKIKLENFMIIRKKEVGDGYDPKTDEETVSKQIELYPRLKRMLISYQHANSFILTDQEFYELLEKLKQENISVDSEEINKGEFIKALQEFSKAMKNLKIHIMGKFQKNE